MPVRIEFYGIARQRAGVASVEIDSKLQTTLAETLAQLARKLPTFGQNCLIDGRLAPALAANLNGERFVSDPATPLTDGQCLLILSADAGG